MRAVLFDLDGTLLDIDMDAFIREYFSALGPVVAEVTGGDRGEALAAVLSATDAMCRPHAGRTNRSVFAENFTLATGTELDDDAWATFDRFYAEVFPALGEGLKPHEGARRAVETALGLGLAVAIATNPIFPAAAVAHRLRWAGVDDLDVDLITTYEQMQACKPFPAYYTEVAERLGEEPSACLMVGDDAVLDMSAADVGMRTFYVGAAPLPKCDWSGSLDDLSALLPRLAAVR